MQDLLSKNDVRRSCDCTKKIIKHTFAESKTIIKTMGYLQYKVHNLSRKYEFMIEGKTLETKTHLMNVVQ